MADIIPFSADQLTISEGLRNLADQIDSGEVQAENLAWVILDEEYITTGLLGIALQPEERAHIMHAKALRYLEGCYD